ncbi:unnamed protein product, partial [Polarella glacialis]
NGLGENPLVLNFRGNALSQLGRFDDAVIDYMEATQIFQNDGEFREASLSRANEALALYGAGRRGEAVRTMQGVVRKDPGLTDMHVALAAVYWEDGKIDLAETEWAFACEKITSGCAAYKDLEWVTEIRRWPLSLAKNLQSFLGEGLQAAVAAMVSPTLIFNGSISGFVGVLLGIIISLIVNCTLVEISISSFFSLYFGFLFVVVGGIILWRIFSQDSADSKESQAKRRPL